MSLGFHWFRRWAAHTRTDLDDIILSAVQGPARLWVLILALELAARAASLPARVAAPIDKALLILWIVSLTMAASRLATRLLRRYGAELQGETPITTLGQNLARLVVVSIGILLMLNVVGVEITPILAALGVGGLAVALGLQETLSNLFSGFFVSVAGHVRVGDYIRLNSGEEGYVTDVTWRETTLRALSNNLVIIPNSKLAQAMVTNFSLPDRRMLVQVAVSVSYDSDADGVERALLEEARAAVGTVPGLAGDPPPFVRLNPGFGEYALVFTVFCHVEEFSDQFSVQHELRKRILRRLAHDGIRIPVSTSRLLVQEHGGAKTGCAMSNFARRLAFEIRRGSPNPFGASEQHGGMNFSVFARHATELNLVLFRPGVGRADCGVCPGPALQPDRRRVAHPRQRAAGGDPVRVPGQSRAQREPARPPLRSVGRSGRSPRRRRWPPASSRRASPVFDDETLRSRRTWRSAVPDDRFDWGFDQPLNVPLADSVIYEVHVRGFTMHPSSLVKHPGTFRGIIEKIPYLKELGITAVELLPVTEFDEHSVPFRDPVSGERLRDYWGYNPLSFFAPKASYAGTREVGRRAGGLQDDGEGAAQGGDRGHPRYRAESHG